MSLRLKNIIKIKILVICRRRKVSVAKLLVEVGKFAMTGWRKNEKKKFQRKWIHPDARTAYGEKLERGLSLHTGL